MSVAEFATKRVVATTIILVAMVFLGLFSAKGMKQERIPKFDTPIVSISTTWTGATAEDVRTQLSKRIEEAVLNVDGIKNITTTSSYGSSSVVVEFNYGADTDIKQVQVQTEINKIEGDLPSDENRKEPVVAKQNTSNSMALLIGITGAEDQTMITSFVEETLKPRLQRNRGVGSVNVWGLERTFLVELDPYKLKSYNLSPSEIYAKIQSAHTISPTGTVEDGTKEFILKVEGELKTVEQLQEIVISNDNNKTLKLKDVANVHYGTKDRSYYVDYNGKDMVAVMIEKSDDGNLVEIANVAKATLEQAKKDKLFPIGTNYEIIVDNSTSVVKSVKDVVQTAILATIIAALVLLVFLKDIKASIVVATSIPISAAFTLFLLNSQGITLNLISLMGLSLAIGSLVDNAVVTLDNIFDHIQVNREPALVAAVRGTNEVIVPMIASTATSVCVWLPIILFNGMAREVFKSISFSMMFALSTSIVVAMLFVPMASSLWLDVNKISGNAEKAKYFNKIKDKYRDTISVVLLNRWKFIGVIAILFVVVVMGLGRTVKTTFFPTVDDSEYGAVATIPTGMDLEVAHEISKQMGDIIKADEASGNVNVIANSTAAMVNVDVKKGHDTMKTIARVREKLSKIPNIDLAVVPEKAGGRAVTKDYAIQIEGEDLDELRRLSNAVAADMKSAGWFRDVKTSLEGGYPQAKLAINRVKAESYGINVTNLTSMLAMGVNGVEPIEIMEGTESIKVTVRFEEQYRNSLDKILNLEVKAGNGQFVRVRDIAYIDYEESASSIETKNGSRIVKVEANLDSSKGMNDASAFANESFKKANPALGYKIAPSGQADNQREMGGELMRAIGLSIVLIYMVLAVQLESFVLPLLIMSTLPLSMIGVIFGLAVTRVQLSMFVMIGILMLFGMAVNNAIVLLDFVSGLRQKGMSIYDAMVEACGSRLRPILMTTLTTVLGWIPMAVQSKGSAGYYQGMAIAVMFGLTFCTILTLFFVPCAYSLWEGFKEERAEKKKAKQREQKQIDRN